MFYAVCTGPDEKMIHTGHQCCAHIAPCHFPCIGFIAGRSLRVPLARRGTADEVTGRETAKKRPATGGYSKASARMRTPRYSPVGGIAGKRLFNRGVSLFMNGRYREAIDIFDRYLAAYPGSPQASEAALYRADCYMRLSNR